MRSRSRLSRAFVVALLICAGATSAGGANSPSALSQRADRLHRADRALVAQQHDALLSLYAFDTDIARATARIDTLRAAVGRVERERASARRRLRAARTTFDVAQRQLALRVHALYVTRSTDALAVVLGASSIEGALGDLETLHRSAQLDRRIARQASHTRSVLRSLAAKLTRRDAQLRELVAAAEEARAALQAERDARSRFVAELTRRRDVQLAELERVQDRARTLASVSVDRGSTATAAAAQRAPRAGTLTVVATGYSSAGTTATGLPAGPGVVAVDPSVIPLGTRLTIPGYGEGVAADTGGSVQGAIVDLWFPTAAEARAWGRRTVDVTLH